jgi:multidrug transporter EmrE-like cation transporter
MNKEERLVNFLIGLDFTIIGILASFVFFGTNYLFIPLGIIYSLYSLFGKNLIFSPSKRDRIIIYVGSIILFIIILLAVLYRPDLFTIKCLFIYNCL